MDKQIKVLLNQYKNIESVNSDLFHKISLNGEISEINEFNIKNVLSVTELFDIERDENQVYRIYGRIEYMSLLNGLMSDYSKFEDIFNPIKTGQLKDIINSFDFYLVRPTDDEWNYIGGVSNLNYNRYFKVIATPNEFELFPVGFSNNIYGEQGYSFNFTLDFDASAYHDWFNFPITEVFLYAQYKPNYNKFEELRATTWNVGGSSDSVIIKPKRLNIGENIEDSTGIKIGDVIEYAKSEFLQIQNQPQTYRITTVVDRNGVSTKLVWKYNPFISIRLRYLTDVTYKANTGSTIYDEVQSIPEYATEFPVGTGNFIWKNVLREGYNDPFTGNGTDHPFVNMKRYVFSSLVIGITPDLSDSITREAFEDIWFTNNTLNIGITPQGDLKDIGKPCK